MKLSSIGSIKENSGYDWNDHYSGGFGFTHRTFPDTGHTSLRYPGGHLETVFRRRMMSLGRFKNNRGEIISGCIEIKVFSCGSHHMDDFDKRVIFAA